MDKKSKGIWLFDDGEKYYCEYNEDEYLEFEYGYLLMKSALIMKNHNMSAFYKMYNKPEVQKKELDGVITLINYVLKSGVDCDIWETVSEIERDIFVKLTASELVRISQKDRNQLSQEIFNDKELPEDLEKILLEECLDEERVNNILMLDKLEYVSTLQDGKYLQGYNIVSMGQLISLEVLNLLRHKNSKICYRRCDCCKKIFMAKIGPGRPQKICKYNYSRGLCKGSHQRELDEKRNLFEKQDRRIKENVRGMIRHHGLLHGELYKLNEEYERYSKKLRNENISTDVYIELTNQWYKELDRPWKK